MGDMADWQIDQFGMPDDDSNERPEDAFARECHEEEEEQARTAGYWITATGERLLVSSLDDAHLRNAYKTAKAKMPKHVITDRLNLEIRLRELEKRVIPEGSRHSYFMKGIK